MKLVRNLVVTTRCLEDIIGGIECRRLQLPSAQCSGRGAVWLDMRMSVHSSGYLLPGQTEGTTAREKSLHLPSRHALGTSSTGSIKLTVEDESRDIPTPLSCPPGSCGRRYRGWRWR